MKAYIFNDDNSKFRELVELVFNDPNITQEKLVLDGYKPADIFCAYKIRKFMKVQHYIPHAPTTLNWALKSAAATILEYLWYKLTGSSIHQTEE